MTDIEICGHVPPYKRIMIGHDNHVPETVAELSVAESMMAAAKKVTDLRIWKLVEQSSQGSALPAKVDTTRAAANKLFDGFWSELQKKGVLPPLLPTESRVDYVTAYDHDGEVVSRVPVDIKTLDWTRLAECDEQCGHKYSVGDVVTDVADGKRWIVKHVVSAKK